MLTRDHVREVDRRAIEQFGLPGVVLMENAGRGAVELLCRESGIPKKVVICAGKGNNGGDGFVMARHLENLGTQVTVLLCANPTEVKGDAGIHLHVLQQAHTPRLVVAEFAPQLEAGTADVTDTITVAEMAHHFDEADWVVDALLGTGFVGTVREPLRSVIRAINRCERPIFAVDLPSGMDCDQGITGKSDELCVKAHLTATFVDQKPGLLRPESAAWTGAVHVVDIGVPRALLQRLAHCGNGQQDLTLSARTI